MSCWNISPRDITKRHPFLSTNRIDIIIFGVTGGIGRYTLLAAVDLLKDVRWGIAGKDRQKLEELMDYIMWKTRTDLSYVPIVIAHKGDMNSIAYMAEKCKVLVNCCESYQEIGEFVIEACIAAGTHHIDMSGEPHNMEEMHTKYHERAKSEHVYLIYGCGFESFLIDIGISFLERTFDGTINSIEAFTEFVSLNSYFKTPVVSGSAWSSFVMSFANLKQLQRLRDRLRDGDVPRLTPVLDVKPLFYKSEFVPGVIFPFPILDEQMVENTQYYLLDTEGKRPIQYRRYITFQSQLIAFIFFVWMFFIILMAQLPWTRKLLLSFPKFFSMGFFAHESPEETDDTSTSFKITLHASGWDGRYRDAYYEFDEEPDTSMILKITGENLGYTMSASCLLMSALTILHEKSRMPQSGGIYSPGPAFKKTSLIQQLEMYDIGPNFEVVI